MATIRYKMPSFVQTVNLPGTGRVDSDGSGWFSTADPAVQAALIAAGAISETEIAAGDPGTGVSLPAGGTTGQSLQKNSNTDGDAIWADRLVLTSVAPVAPAAAANVGADAGAAHGDHVHPYPAALPLANLAPMAASTVVANNTGGSASPTALTLTALATAIGVTAGGLGQVRVYYPASNPTTVAVSQSRGETQRIAIPAGVFGKFSFGFLLGNMMKVTAGAVDTPSLQIYAGATGFGAFGTGNQLASGIATAASANAAAQFGMLLFGNRADQTTIHAMQQGNTASPYSSSIVTANVLNYTLNTANAWDIACGITTGANDTAKVQDMVFIVFNPELANYSASFSNIAGVATDNAALVTYINGIVDPGVSVEAAGRALTQADNGKTLEYTGAGAGSFTVPNTLTAPFSCEVVQWAAGVPTFVTDGTSVVRVPTGKSASAASQYDSVAIQLMSTGPVTVRVV